MASFEVTSREKAVPHRVPGKARRPSGVVS
jgi:hypothetical protein